LGCDKTDAITHPIEEFNRCHQKGKVSEYIRSFEKAKNILLHISSAFTKDILIAQFIGGLKEDIRHKVGVLEPDTLNVAYKYVLRYELDIEGQHKLAKTPSKFVASINYKEWSRC
jgi:hypothetical protein